MINDNVIKIQLWDTAGQEKFHSVTSGFYRNAAGVFLIYEISRQESFDEISVKYSKYKLSEMAFRKQEICERAHLVFSSGK